MIVFYRKNHADIILAAIIKHYNPDTIIKEYSDNKQVLSFAKSQNNHSFLRVNDWSEAIMIKYKTPSWIHNNYRQDFIKNLLCHKDVETGKVVNFIALNLFNPENIFEAYTEEVITMREMVEQVKKEITLFRQNIDKKVKDGIIYVNINPVHNIADIMAEELMDDCTLPLIIFQGDYAVVGNAEQLGFKTDFVKTTRYEALRIKKEIVVERTLPQKTVTTKNTTLMQY